MQNHQNPVPDWLNESYVEKFLRHDSRNPDLKVIKLEITPGSKPGDNYACQVFRMQCELQDKKDLVLIGKVKPDTKTCNVLDSILDIFAREGAFYDEVAPYFQKRSKEAAKYLPKCYHVDFPKKFIVMEDLKVRGYELQPKAVPLNLHQALMVIESIADFHGNSLYALQERPEYKIRFDKTMWGRTGNTFTESLFKNGMIHIKKDLKKFGLPEHMQEDILALEETLNKYNFDVIERRDNSLNVICHGDLWMNNMLFHYKNGVADSLTLLDFQIINYNSFANDLIYFLFTSVDSDAIVQNLDRILLTYQQKLVAASPSGIDLSLERIKADFNDRLFFGFILLMFFRSIIMADALFDLDKAVDGEIITMNYLVPKYLKDLQVLLPLLHKAGALHYDPSRKQ